MFLTVTWHHAQALIGEVVVAMAEARTWAARDQTHQKGTAVVARRNEERHKGSNGKVLRFDGVTGSYAVEFGTKKEPDRQDIPASRIRAVEPFNVLYYYKQRKDKLPEWFKAAKLLVLLQPSSAAAERVFSLLEIFFSKKGLRGSVLSDAINATIKLMSHDRKM